MDEVELYYQSLREVYDDIRKSRTRKPTVARRIVDFLHAVSIVVLVGTLLPVLPFATLFLAQRMNWTPLGFDLSQPGPTAMFVVWLFLMAIAIGLIIALEYIQRRIYPKDEALEKSLSPDQVGFMAVYDSYQELKIYTISRLDLHLDKAQSAFETVMPRKRVIVPPISGHDERTSGTIPYYPSAEEPTFARQVRVARDFLRSFGKSHWLADGEVIKEQLRSFVSVPDNIHARLEQKYELPSTLEALCHLSRFLYSNLPEHTVNLDATKVEILRDSGRRSLGELLEITDSMEELPPVQVKREDTRGAGAWLRIQRLLSSSVAARFILWFLLLLVLIGAAVFVFNRFLPLSQDAMASIIIGTSAVVAGGLAVFLPAEKPTSESAANDEDA